LGEGIFRMRGLPNGQIDVLFAAYGGGHVTMLRPVSQEISRRGLSVGFLGLTTAQADLARHGIDYFGYAELDGANDAQVQAWGRELVGPELPGSAVSYFESVAYHGLNFRDLVAAGGEAAARKKYDKHGRQGFLPVATMEALLRKLNPRVVVATNSPRSERAIFEAARNLRIPSVCIVDLFAIQEVKWIAEPDYATTICVLNEQVADFFIAQGCPPNSVVATGNPAFDMVASPESQIAGKALREKRGFGTSEKVILWASNVEPEAHPFTGAAGDITLPARIEAALRDAVAREHTWQLVVRYHPSEKVDFHPGPRVSASPREEDLHALIHAVDVVVVMSSTIGLEAHLAGRPVISVDSSVFTADAPYSRMGISTGISNLDELHDAIKQVLHSGSVARVSVGEWGTATQAVTQEIMSLSARLES
jgi:hypothetical protein